VNEKLIMGVIQAIEDNPVAYMAIRRIFRRICTEVLLEVGLVQPKTETEKTTDDNEN